MTESGRRGVWGQLARFANGGFGTEIVDIGMEGEGVSAVIALEDLIRVQIWVEEGWRRLVRVRLEFLAARRDPAPPCRRWAAEQVETTRTEAEVLDESLQVWRISSLGAIYSSAHPKVR
jgi:hypothetical protein